MNLYSRKQQWKFALLLIALIISGAIIWYAGHIATKVQEDERQKVKLWSEAMRKKAELVNLTNQSFEELGEQEKKKVQLWVRATKEIEKDLDDYSFIIEVIQQNSNIPLILTDANNNYITSSNFSFDKKTLFNQFKLTGQDSVTAWQNAKTAFADSISIYIETWPLDNEPIVVKYDGNKSQKIFYRNSDRFFQLKTQRDSLIHAFNNDLVENAALVPVIFLDSITREVIATNLPESQISDAEKLMSQIARMEAENPHIKVQLDDDTIGIVYYSDSNALKQLRQFPYVVLGLIGVFLIVAYFLFSTFRKAEQNRVWVGMAKETAHQLGTPLSSLMAWLELLRSQGVDEGTLGEMNKDLVRLEMITQRFSKIGSEAELTPQNIEGVINNSIAYLKSRVSKNVAFEFDINAKITAQLNIPLFEWVLENLVKNAVDSMEGSGKITFKAEEKNNKVYLDISDTGKGIAQAKFKTVFEPGYTTKKRGWGLGLSLVKRIIENYHRGKIFVHDSEPGKGTTFRIILNKE
ncbi:MAG: sensor histidine kinase [Flavobacteriales bacterium]